MGNLLDTLFWALAVFVPIVVFTRVVGKPRISRRDVLVATTFAGATVGLVLALVIAVGGAGLADAWPWVLASTVSGLLIGAVGLAARALGVWLSRAP